MTSSALMRRATLFLVVGVLLVTSFLWMAGIRDPAPPPSPSLPPRLPPSSPPVVVVVVEEE
jgi:hypothetical protein